MLKSLKINKIHLIQSIYMEKPVKPVQNKEKLEDFSTVLKSVILFWTDVYEF